MREYSTFVGQFTSGFHGSLVDDGHDSVDFVEGLLAVILNSPHDKVVSHSHESEADTASLLCHVFDALDWQIKSIYNILQHTNSN